MPLGSMQRGHLALEALLRKTLYVADDPINETSKLSRRSSPDLAILPPDDGHEAEDDGEVPWHP